jgi:hypothetical protein
MSKSKGKNESIDKKDNKSIDKKDNKSIDKSIDKSITSIEEKLKELNKCVNLGDILKQNKNVEIDINKLEGKIKNLQNEVEKLNENDEDDKSDLIDDEKYQKYVLDIEKYVNDFDNLHDVEKQVETYKKMLHKIKLCEEYLNSKKIEIIKIN